MFLAPRTMVVGGRACPPPTNVTKTLVPGLQTYGDCPTTTTVVTGGTYEVVPGLGYRALYPRTWSLPAAIVGILISGIRFTFTALGAIPTTLVRENSLPVGITETREDVDFEQDGRTLTKVEFVGRALAGITTQTLGTFRFEGEAL